MILLLQVVKLIQTIDDAENLDLVMPMYNLIEYSSNYFERTGSLWFHSKDEPSNFNADIASDVNFKSFLYKSKLLESTEADGAMEFQKMQQLL